MGLKDLEPVRFYVDANIFIKAFEGQDPVSHALLRLLSDPAASRAVLMTSQLTLAETIQKPYADRNERLIGIYESWLRAGTASLEVGPITADVLYFAAVLRSEYPSIRLPDAIHLSAAFALKADIFLSDDKRLPETIALLHTRSRVAGRPHRMRRSAATIEFLDALLDDNQP